MTTYWRKSIAAEQLSPPSRKGGGADQANATLPLIGAAGEVRHFLQQRSDLPGRALPEVARHFLKGRNLPSSKDGKAVPSPPLYPLRGHSMLL